MTQTLYRIQNAEGRGPFIPGYSRTWVDAEKSADRLPPIFEEVGGVEAFYRLIPQGKFCGCACKSVDALYAWFSRAERRRLARDGFRVVAFVPDEVLIETPTQVLFANNAPLSTLSKMEDAA